MFFNLDKVKQVEKEPTHRAYGCEQCKLYLNCKTPQIAPFGEGRLGILLIIDNVTKSQEDTNNNNQGSNYLYMQKRLKEVGIDIHKDC